MNNDIYDLVIKHLSEYVGSKASGMSESAAEYGPCNHNF